MKYCSMSEIFDLCFCLHDLCVSVQTHSWMSVFYGISLSTIMTTNGVYHYTRMSFPH